MNSAIFLKELQALKEKIASLERENNSLKKFVSKNAGQIHEHESSQVANCLDEGPSIQRLNENDKLLTHLFNEALDGILFYDRKGIVVKANKAACKILNLTGTELIGNKITDYIYIKDEKYKKMKKYLLDHGELSGEVIFMIPVGEKKILEFTVKLNAGKDYHMAIFRDVSRRYKMEQNLRKSEEKFRKIFEGSLEGMVLWDEDFQGVEMNPSGAEMLGLDPERIKGKKLSGLLEICGISKEVLEEKYRILLKEGKIKGSIQFETDGGKIKHFQYSTKHNLVDGLNLTIFRDVTEKKEMEEQLRKSDTLNMLGELAAGIAHEIRNPMTALKGFIQLLESSIGEDFTLYFQVITSELQRIDSIINEFLILAKPQVIKYLMTDVSKIMKETVDLLTAQAVLHDVQFITDYKPELPSLLCEPNQLKKVFINIIKNAIEVMPSGGFVTVTIQHDIERGIHISIKDEGAGIPEEKIRKLGEPFYTTKERGTGLGLMVSYKIVEEHGGSIEIESKIGEGSIFHIYLPLNRME